MRYLEREHLIGTWYIKKAAWKSYFLTEANWYTIQCLRQRRNPTKSKRQGYDREVERFQPKLSVEYSKGIVT